MTSDFDLIAMLPEVRGQGVAFFMEMQIYIKIESMEYLLACCGIFTKGLSLI